MKNILKSSLKLSVFALALISFVGCQDDDLAGMDAQAKPTAKTTVSSITLAEGESDAIPFTISQAISKPSQFKIEKVSGALSQTDLTFGDGDMDADTGIPHVGYEITVPAYATSFDIPVEAFVDNLSLVCGDQLVEAGVYRITAAGVRTILTPNSNGYLINVTVTGDQTDAPLIYWTLDLFDSYGDGWNGASIDVTVDGTTNSYTLDDGSEGTLQIPVASGGNYTFSFSSGDWDGEITYTLTDPDGNTWSDGPTPTVGAITSGVQATVCPE